MKNKKIVVTGGLGFIGSHLVERFTENNDVIIVDNQSTGSIENIRELDTSRIDTTFGSINNLNLEEIFEGADYVFHLAAVTSVPQSVEDPVKSNEVNITGTLKVLEAARKTDVTKLVFSSSSAVYGETEVLPITEEVPINPLSPYAVSKATAELYCNVYSEIYDLPTTCLRYFNVFGPKQDPNSQYAAVIPIFIDKLLKNERPTIYGDGEQTRDFVSVDRVVEANELAAKSKETGIFNIGLGKSTSINQLYELVKESVKKDIEPVYEPARSGEIKHSVADVSKAQAIGFKPESGYKDDLIKTIDSIAYNLFNK